MNKKGKILIGTAIGVGAACAAYEIVQLTKQYYRTRDDIEHEADARIRIKKNTRKELVEKTMEKNIDRFEQAMQEHGAVLRDDLDKSNIGKFGLRPIFEYKDCFYRVGTLSFEEEDNPYIVINAIDSEKFAKIGVMEEIEAYPYDMPEDRIHEVVAEFLDAEL